MYLKNVFFISLVLMSSCSTRRVEKTADYSYFDMFSGALSGQCDNSAKVCIQAHFCNDKLTSLDKRYGTAMIRDSVMYKYDKAYFISEIPLYRNHNDHKEGRKVNNIAIIKPVGKQSVRYWFKKKEKFFVLIAVDSVRSETAFTRRSVKSTTGLADYDKCIAEIEKGSYGQLSDVFNFEFDVMDTTIVAKVNIDSYDGDMELADIDIDFPYKNRDFIQPLFFREFPFFPAVPVEPFADN